MSKQDIKWILSAKDTVNTVLKKVNKSLQETAAQNKSTGQSVEETASRIDSLKDELSSLNDALKKTKSAKTSASNLKQLGAAASELEDRLKAARDAEKQASQALKEASEPSDKAQKLLKSRIALQTQLQSRLNKAKDALENLNAAHEAETITQKQYNDQTTTAEKKIADLTVRLERQNKAVKESEDALDKASSGLGELQSKQQQAAEQAKKLGREHNAMQQQVSKAKAALSAVGVETKDLEQAERKLTQQQKDLTAKVKDTKEAIKDLGTQTDRAKGKMTGLFRASRTSMSVYQRLRGQVLSLAAAYIGLYGAVDQVRSVVNTVREMEAAQARFRVAFGGDQKKVRQEMEYTRRASDELGLDFLKQAKTYSKLQVASQKTELQGERIRYIWSSMAIAGRVLRSSQEEIEGAMYAVEQIISKGTVTSEELKQQLGDRMPGAVSIMAAALGVGTEELNKMMEQGQITRNSLVEFAEELRDRFSGELPEAMNSLDAKIARLGNTWRDIQMQFAESGFIDEFAIALEHLNAALQSEEGKAGARELGRLIAGLIRGFVLLLENIETVKTVLLAFGGAVAFKWAVGLLGSIRDVAGVFIWLGKRVKKVAGLLIRTFATGATKAAIFKSVLWRGFAFLFGPAGVVFSLLAVAGSYIFDWLYERSEGFRRWFYDIRTWWQQFVVTVKTSLSKAGAYVTSWAKEAANSISQALTNPLNFRGDGKGFKFFDEVKSQLKTEVDQLEQLAQEEKDRIKRSLDALFVKGESERKKAGNKAGNLTKSTGAKGTGTSTVLNQRKPSMDGLQITTEGKNDKDAKKLASELERVREKLTQITIEASTGTEKLRLQLGAVDSAYKELLAEATKQKGAKSEEVGLIKQLIAAEKRQLEIAHEKQTLQNAEQRVNDLLSQRRDLMERITFLQEQGKVVEANGLKQDLKAVNEELSFALDQAIALAKAMGNEAMVLSLQKMKDQVAGLRQQITTAEEMNKSLASGLTDVFKAGVNGFSSMKDAFLSFASSFLAKIAEMILQQAIFNALKNAGGGGGGVGGFISSAINGLFLHSGGVVGSGDGRGSNVMTQVFAGAQRFHSGGLPGLKPDEVPAILQKGEEVLTKNDPRHILNGGGGQSAETPINLNNINVLDSDDMAQAIYNSSSSDRLFLNKLKAVKQKANAILGS